jgi:hypothetical protein
VGALYAAAYRGAGAGAAEGVVLGQTLVWLPVVLVVVNIPLFLWGRRLPQMRTRIR